MDITYEVVEHISTLSEQRGITTELNLVAWNDAEPKFDLRKWDRRGDEKPMKGLTLSREEVESLSDALRHHLSDDGS